MAHKVPPPHFLFCAQIVLRYNYRVRQINSTKYQATSHPLALWLCSWKIHYFPGDSSSALSLDFVCIPVGSIQTLEIRTTHWLLMWMWMLLPLLLLLILIFFVLLIFEQPFVILLLQLKLLLLLLQYYVDGNTNCWALLGMQHQISIPLNLII